jgi:hypothetical protein
MLKKEFKFEKQFEELENGKFGNFDDVKFFGIKNKDNYEVRNQVDILYYNSKDDFAIKLKTKEIDEETEHQDFLTREGVDHIATERPHQQCRNSISRQYQSDGIFRSRKLLAQIEWQ